MKLEKKKFNRRETLINQFIRQRKVLLKIICNRSSEVSGI